MNYKEAVDYLYAIPKFTHEPSLLLAEKLLKELGSPEKSMKIIHVAGTNGKGSVCAYTASVLLHAGKTVGLFTSPHLVHMEERIRVNGENISEDKFLEAFHVIKYCEEKLCGEYGRFSFFEYLFGMAMYCFEDAKVEYVVLETGLGGRLDATNAVKKPIVSIITPVSLDHVSVLGNTVEEIAAEKAGIIKEGAPVIYWAEDTAVKSVIEAKAWEVGSVSYPLDKKNYEILQINDKSVDFCAHNRYHKIDRYKVPFTAQYQVENALLAIEALQYLGVRDADITYDVIAEGIKTTRWQGRFEEISEGIIVDGAHNEAGVKSFIEAVATREQGVVKGKRYLLFAVMKDKDYHEMIRLICDNIEFETIIVTKSGGDRGLNLNKLLEEFGQYTVGEVLAMENWEEAFEKGKSVLDRNDTLYCVGSLYLVGDILEKYGR